MACPNCGSWAVRADRSLAGRLVCARCGEPLGIGAGRRRSAPPRRAPRRGGGSGGRRGLWLGLAALLAVSALLAVRSERGADSPGLPRTRPLAPGSVSIH